MRRLGRATLYLTVSQAVFMLSGYLINIWLGKRLGPSEYGLYGIVITFMSLINIMQTAGLPQSLSKYLAGDPEHEGAILATSLKLQLVITTILTLLMAALSYPASRILHDPSLSHYLLAASAVLPFYGLFSLYMGYYNGLHRFGRQALMNIIYSILKIVLVVYLTLTFGLYGVISAFAISPLFALAAGIRLPQFRERYPWRKLAYFSLPLIAFAITSTSQLSIDLFILKIHRPTNEVVGYYVAAQNIARLPYYALISFAFVLFPSVASLLKDRQMERLRRMVSVAMKYLILFLVLGVTLIASESKTFIKVLYNSQYLPASTALKILLLGYSFLLLFTVLSNVISGAGEPGKALRISVLGLIVTIACCSVLIPLYGMAGAAEGTAIGSFVAMCATYIYLYRTFSIPIPLWSAARIAGAGMLTYLLISWCHFPDSMSYLFISIVLGTFIYMVFVVLFRVLLYQDILQLKALFMRKTSAA